jgi:hypothetical protein
MVINSFWKLWDKLDELKQVKHIEFIAEMLDSYRVIKNKKQRLYAMSNTLNSYFEDVYNYGKSIRK